MHSEKDRFPTLVLEKEGLFHCLIPELSLFESGKDLSQVYELIQKKKGEIFREVKESHLEALLLPKKEKAAYSKGKWINYLLVGFFLMVPILTMTHSLSIFLTKAARVIPKNPIDGVIVLGRCVKNMPNDKKQELREAAQALLAEFDRVGESQKTQEPF